MTRLLRRIGLLASLLLLAACDPTADLKDPPRAEFARFKLGHNITIARNPTATPGTIPVTEAEWQAAMQGAIEKRFGHYDGDRLYHFGISVDGYFLSRLDAGVPGVPSLKSLLFLTVTLWDDALGRKLNDKAHEVAVVSAFTDTGPFPTKEVLLDKLTAQAALEIQNWMLEHPEWFTPPFE